jgi:hypothetical protein
MTNSTHLQHKLFFLLLLLFSSLQAEDFIQTNMQARVRLDFEAIPLGRRSSFTLALGEMQTSDERFQAHTLLLGLNIHLSYLYRR